MHVFRRLGSLVIGHLRRPAVPVALEDALEFSADVFEIHCRVLAQTKAAVS